MGQNFFRRSSNGGSAHPHFAAPLRKKTAGDKAFLVAGLG